MKGRGIVMKGMLPTVQELQWLMHYVDIMKNKDNFMFRIERIILNQGLVESIV